MGRLNPILGSMRGKYGGSVLYRYNGKQCIRERVITVSNPKTSKQAIQRAILATCGRFVSAFAPVLNNAIQSETSKVKTLAKIRSLNMDYLRGLAAAGEGQFNPKGVLSIMSNDYIVSRGSLVGLNPLRSAAARTMLGSDGELQFAARSLVINATATASQAFPTVAVGDQITLLAVTNNDDDDIPMVGYCRFAFKDNETPVFVLVEGNNYRLNASAIDVSKAAGNWADVMFMSDDNAIYMPPVIGDFVGDPIDLAAVIVSRESERLRSTSYAVASDHSTNFPIDVAYPTYMDGGSDIDMVSEVYLNNSATPTTNTDVYLYSSGERVTAPVSVSGNAVLGVIGGTIDIAGGLLIRQFTKDETQSVVTTPIDGEAHGSGTSGYWTIDPDTREISVTYSGPAYALNKLMLVVGNRSYTILS